MFHRRQRPFADRLDAQRPINSELLAAIAGAPVELAERFATVWFAAVDELCARGRVLVFDEFVVGLPDPLLLEAAHHVRLVRRAEAIGLFDDEAERWYDEHPDDDDAFWEPPSIPDRVFAAMASGQEADRLTAEGAVAAAVRKAFGSRSATLWEEIELALAVKALVVSLADAIRIGDAAVVDARLPGERIPSWRTAA